MRGLLRFTFVLGLAGIAACSGPAKLSDFDRKLDDRIQEQLTKRLALVQTNALYSGLVSELQKGRELLLNGKASEAFITFDKILQNSKYVNFPEYSFSKYYLASALYEMGVDYGALLYFVDIVEKEPLKIHTHESLRRAISIAQKLKDDELVLYLASTITPDKVPLSLREEFRYFIAKDLYQKGNYAKSVSLFGDITHRNRLYLAARYMMGTAAVRQGDLKEAIERFRDISNNRTPTEYYEDGKIRELANMALGRIFYEQRNYPLSIVYYRKVDRKGEFYPLALYESSWVLFKLNKFNESLAVLHSLNSPFFEQVYFLKSMLLKGAIFIELCMYPEAINSLGTVEKDFKRLRGQIDQFAKEARSPQLYYATLSSTTPSRDGGKQLRYDELFRLSAANRDFLGVHRYIMRLSGERELLRSVKSPRGELLGNLLQQKARDLTVKASWLAGKKLVITRKLIDDFEDTKDVVRYEIVAAERKVLQTRTMHLAPPVLTGQEIIKPEFTESLRESLIWWDWNGEYWQDEIGAYLFDQKSRCRDAGAAKK